MEQKKKTQADIPSDYVTLAQLQERWVKEQERKKKEKEKQNLQDKLLNQQQLQHQHEIESQPQKQRSKEVPHGSAARPRDGPRRFQLRTEHRRGEIKGDAVACPEEIDSGAAAVAVVAVAQEVEGRKEAESERQKKKKKGKWKGTKKKDGKGNPRVVGEEEKRTGSEEHPPKELGVERNMGGIQGRRSSWKKVEKQVELRLKAVKSGVERERNGAVENLVEESDQTVENEIEIENVVGETDPAGEDDREIGNAVEESDQMVNVVGESVEGKLGELAIGGNGKLRERQGRVVNRGNVGYGRPYNTGIYRMNEYRRGAGGGRGDYGRYGGVNGRYWQFRSGHGETNWSGRRKGKDNDGGMIWVRKDKVAHSGGDVTGNGKHSSLGISSKQMG